MFDKIEHIGYVVADLDKAVAWFQQGTNEQQQAFLTLLLFKPR